jgi:hypothetical protein
MWISGIAWSELSCSFASKAALGVASWTRKTSCAGTEDSGLAGAEGGGRDEKYELELLESRCHDNST